MEDLINITLGVIMQEKIFRTYDIRGVLNKEFHVNDVEKIVLSIIEIFKPKTISLAHDVREENVLLYTKAKEVCEREELKELYLLGRVPTTIFYVFNKIKKVDLGLIFTSSHNPPGYGGIKIIHKGKSIMHEDIEKIKKLSLQHKNIHKKIPHQTPMKYQKHIKKVDYKNTLEIYFKYLSENITPLNTSSKQPRIRMICDIAQGSFSTPIIEYFLKGLEKILKTKIEPILLNHIDDKGKFSHHLPDTSDITNYSSLIEASKKHSTWGIGFDGDSDRIMIVDPKGRVYPSEYIAYLIAKYYNLNKILVEVSTSKYITQLMESQNMRVKTIRTGHIFMEKYMAKYDMEIGAERSGHFYFKTKNLGYVEDSILILTLFLNLILNKDISEEIIRDATTNLNYFSYVDKIPLEKGIFSFQKIKKSFSNCNIIEIDGIRIECDDFWFLIRKSNTEDLVRVVVESRDKKILQQIKDKIIDLIHEEN